MFKVTEHFLVSNGFTINGNVTHREFALKIPDIEFQGEDLEDKQSVCLLFALPTQELFIECSDDQGETVGLTQIPVPRDPDTFITLLQLLGAK